MPTESITLYFRQGGSDKLYQATLAEQDSGFVVSFAFGRRGSTLQTGTKTHVPVTFDEAKKIYDKLVREKTAKGYTPAQTERRMPAPRTPSAAPESCRSF